MKKLNLKKEYIVLVGIFLLSLFPRLYQINRYPPSLNWDEVSLGYNAYSILKTGKDEWANELPLIFRAYGDFKLPLYIYLSVIPIFFMGLNPLSVKLISIVFGSLAPIIIYLIGHKITKNKQAGLLISLIYSLSPWSIFLSRIALEANLFLTLFLLSVYFLLLKKISLSLIFFSLGLFSYNSSRVLFPFYLLTIFIYFIKQKRLIKKNIVGIIFFAIASFVFIGQSIDPSGRSRFKWVSLIDQGAINQINRLRQTYPRVVANKATYFVIKSTQNYLSHFNPRFLFINGGSHYQFSIPHFYLISPLLAPFLIIGIFYLIKQKQYLLLFLFLISPLPSSITRDAPHTLRSIVFISLSTLISGFGLYHTTNTFKKHSKLLFVLSTFIIIAISQINFWNQYKIYTINFSQSWQYGHRQVIDFIKQNYQNYDNIYITKKYGEPHQFLLFYWPWPPSDYQNDSRKIWDYHADWYWVDKFDKFTFVNDWEIADLSIPNSTLLITGPNNFPAQSGKIIQTINFLDQTIAFQIVSYE